ncbi:MAG TPA: nucleoside hydrolase-like domain-containing protein, partial [Gemmatimonadaceae bacterium]|nr:nucleoside hydrolase-like domain-containing protein [Gemmatimonadaceae bacterium]
NRFGLNLCPCTSWRWAPGERFIDNAVETYERVYPNLRTHDARYPTPRELKSKIRIGNVEFDGDISKDSPGSALIKRLLLDSVPGPLYLLAWGGGSTIARALKSIEDRYSTTADWPAIRDKVSRKAVLSFSGDQDDTYADYIHPHWPDMKTLAPGRGVDLAYGAQTRARPEDTVYYSAAWMRANVSSVGPFGAFYRVWGDGKQMVKGDIFDYFGVANASADSLKKLGYVVWLPPRPQGEFLGEGDTFTYLNLGEKPYNGDVGAAQKALAERLRWSVNSGH